MLEKLLYEIQSSNVTLQPQTLAARLNISVGMVQAMLENLERMGLIQSMNNDCASTCGGCTLSQTCGSNFPKSRVWTVKSTAK